MTIPTIYGDVPNIIGTTMFKWNDMMKFKIIFGIAFMAKIMISPLDIFPNLTLDILKIISSFQ